nr:MAG TPA: hypothetical protein [Caudoviricetes sp.]
MHRRGCLLYHLSAEKIARFWGLRDNTLFTPKGMSLD